VGEYDASGVATRAGVPAEYVTRLLDLGILAAETDGRLSIGDARKVQVIRAVEEAGVSLESLAAATREGVMSLDFVDAVGNEVFASLTDETFAEVSSRTGVPLDLLKVVREAVGGIEARPDDLVRDDELAVVPLIQLQLAEGFRPIAIERGLRVMGDSLRRVAETEAEWFRSEIVQPMLDAGLTENDVGKRMVDLSPRLAPPSVDALVAIYHAQERHTWMNNMVIGIAGALARAGLQDRLERSPPAMCFLDITGYTRLTQESGDQAAAKLAETLSRLVQRTSVQHGGRPVKWLGDGVMFYFPDPGPGVVAALEMVEGVTDAGLPPAHVGLHAGPVLFQEGDYYGQTVNMASRIGDYARPGEVLVSQEVVDASQGAGVSFREIGPVGLKGVSGVVRLHAAHR
jgi:adenylate cyclase